MHNEMIARAPHFTTVAGVRTADPAFLVNCEKVWDIITRITRSHDCWTYVKPAQRTQDGRKAYLDLYTHYLGPNNVDNMATQAEDKLKSTAYSGEQRRWNFEKYVNVHKQQHSIMEGLVELGYVGIDPRSKTTSKSKGNPNNVNISEVQVHSGGKRKHSDEVEDGYYAKSEYDALSPAQKADLANKRAKRGHKAGAKDSKVKGKGKGNGDGRGVSKTLKAMNRTVSQLAKQIGKTDMNVPNDTSDATESSNDTQPRAVKFAAGTNRNNSSLTRQTVTRGI